MTVLRARPERRAPIRPPRRVSLLRERAREAVAERIISGRLQPGLPLNLTELAADLDVSVTPVREALFELQQVGLLDSHANRGFAVRPLSIGEVEEVYPVIAALESLALRSSVPSLSALDELDRINGRFAAANDAVRYVAVDREWHDALLAGCVNRLLLATLADLKRRAWRYEVAYMRYSGRLLESSGQHAAITRALRRRQRARASRLLEKNWEVGPTFLVPWLQRIQGT